MKTRTGLTIGLALSMTLLLAFGGAAMAWGPSRGGDDRGGRGRYCDGPRGGGWDRDMQRGGRDCDMHRGGRDDRGYHMGGGYGDGPCGGVLGDGPQVLGPFALDVLRDLDLTREQRDKVRGLLEAKRGEIRTSWDGLRDLREDLRREALAAKPDEGKIKDLSRRLGEAVGSAALLGTRVANDLKGVLTPEQRERLDEARRDLEDWGFGMHHGRGGCR